MPGSEGWAADAVRSLPIGVFDSGIGGLTVVAALRARLPAESILYLGDTARLPYGTKSAETVLRYTRKNVDFLLDRGIKAVVVACNTASALAVPHLAPTLPLWGVIEPGAARAAATSAGRVGVIATESTIRSDAYAEALRRIRPELDVRSQACPLFVPLVEEGWADDPIAEAIARRYLEPLTAAGVDTLVLGCTHYPLLRPVLARVTGPGIELVDSASAVAGQVAHDLQAAGLAAPAGGPPGELHAYVTDSAERFACLAHQILDGDLTFELVDVT
ncbi:MAG TPA: glutamate racemase [Thermoanaerobaculia bacterium]|nr:glutamate racemase [Thermoanaerobaculia bacterium]